MNKQKITPDSIFTAIEKAAEIMVKKYELYENIKTINGELKNLYESAPPMVGSYGFVLPDNSTQKANVTGFETSPNISFIAQLEKEMGVEKDTQLNEVDFLKVENEKLRQEIEELKKK